MTDAAQAWIDYAEVAGGRPRLVMNRGRVAICCDFTVQDGELVPGPCERHLWHAVAGLLMSYGLKLVTA